MINTFQKKRSIEFSAQFPYLCIINHCCISPPYLHIINPCCIFPSCFIGLLAMSSVRMFCQSDIQQLILQPHTRDHCMTKLSVSDSCLLPFPHGLVHTHTNSILYSNNKRKFYFTLLSLKVIAPQ